MAQKVSQSCRLPSNLPMYATILLARVRRHKTRTGTDVCWVRESYAGSCTRCPMTPSPVDPKMDGHGPCSKHLRNHHQCVMVTYAVQGLHLSLRRYPATSTVCPAAQQDAVVSPNVDRTRRLTGAPSYISHCRASGHDQFMLWHYGGNHSAVVACLCGLWRFVVVRSYTIPSRLRLKLQSTNGEFRRKRYIGRSRTRSRRRRHSGRLERSLVEKVDVAGHLWLDVQSVEMLGGKAVEAAAAGIRE
ncbi:hypothetical protein BDW22DRAFT_1350643 [Trametopsis cervina]|nr:hypothetical protein BDW22DRAFT_1350643 [Trametopsis cervina]